MRNIVFSFIGIFFILSTHTQTVNAQTAPLTNESSENPLLAKVFSYLDKIQYVTPGKGVAQITLGMPLRDVINFLGSPASSDRRGVLNRHWVLLYETDLNTYVKFVGDKVVEEIVVQGNIGFQTPAGVSFGMSHHQVKLIYGIPTSSEQDQLVYTSRGIRFTLKNEVVYQMHVFPREAKN